MRFEDGLVAARTGTFYGIPMTAGDIYTAAGNPDNHRIPSDTEGWPTVPPAMAAQPSRPN